MTTLTVDERRERRKQIIKQLQAGVPQETVVRETGLSGTYVANVALMAGIRKPRAISTRSLKIALLIHCGMNDAEISAQEGILRSGVNALRHSMIEAGWDVAVEPSSPSPPDMRRRRPARAPSAKRSRLARVKQPA